MSRIVLVVLLIGAIAILELLLWMLFASKKVKERNAPVNYYTSEIPLVTRIK